MGPKFFRNRKRFHNICSILYNAYHYVYDECLKVFLEMTKLWKFRMRLHDIFGHLWTTHTRLSIDWEHVSQSTWPRYETLERTLTYLVPVATAQFAYPFDTTYIYVYMHNFWVLHKHLTEVKAQMQLHMQVKALYQF